MNFWRFYLSHWRFSFRSTDLFSQFSVPFSPKSQSMRDDVPPVRSITNGYSADPFAKTGKLLWWISLHFEHWAVWKLHSSLHQRLRSTCHELHRQDALVSDERLTNPTRGVQLCCKQIPNHNQPKTPGLRKLFFTEVNFDQPKTSKTITFLIFCTKVAFAC